MCNRYVKENKDPEVFGKVKCLQNELDSIIESNKQKYYSCLLNMLIDPMASSKVYWSTLKMFLNNEKVVVFHHQDTKISTWPVLKRKLKYSAPSLLSNALWWIAFLNRTEKIISLILFSSNDIAKIIRDLDPNKAHGHDMISKSTFRGNFQILHRKRTVS